MIKVWLSFDPRLEYGRNTYEHTTLYGTTGLQVTLKLKHPQTEIPHTDGACLTFFCHLIQVLSQHWFKWWVGAKQGQQAITWTINDLVYWLTSTSSGGGLNIKMLFYQLRDSHYKQMSFIMGILLLGKTVFCIEMGPRALNHYEDVILPVKVFPL